MATTSLSVSVADGCMATCLILMDVVNFPCTFLVIAPISVAEGRLETWSMFAENSTLMIHIMTTSAC